MAEVKKYYPNISPRYNLDGPSVYGEPDEATLGLLDRLHGRVLEVGAGDGRYTHPMLDRKLEVVAGDVDSRALDSLVKKTPREHVTRVHPVIFDAFEKFPFPDEQFDAVVSTAFLYLYPKQHIDTFLDEAYRVTKKEGQVLIDFVYNRQRTDVTGKKIVGEHEVAYDSDGTWDVIGSASRRLFAGLDVRDSVVEQDLLQTAGYKMLARKKSVLFEKGVYL